MTVSASRLAVLAAALLVTTPAIAEEVKREAVVVSVDGGNINARTREGPITVVVAPSTRISETSGLLSRKSRDSSALLPGLIFTVKGDQQGNVISAEDITFKDRDWRAAVAAKAGTTQEFEKAAAERAELRKAIIEGQEYVIQEEATVYFATGSAVISSAHKAELRALAQKAPSFGNYRISILGFTDPVGNPAANERLSLRRAGAVSNYLRQTGLIQPGRVLSPSAMGESGSTPDIAAPTSNNQARRVVVRIVTPKTQLTR